MSEKAKLDAVQDVDIDENGKFKYVLIKIYTDDEGLNCKNIVRGYGWAGYHADIYDDTSERLSGLGIHTECLGGGRILHNPDTKTVTVFGYSMGFGKADHSISTELIKKRYPSYDNITWNDEGY